MAESHFPQILEAASFAARVHDGHLRKDGRTPYVSHVYRVCMVVRDLFGFDEPNMLMTALLHDAVEDTKTDFDDLAEQFPEEVARWVGLLSKDKRLPEAEREQAYLEQLTTAPWQVRACKLGDIYDNLSDLPRMPPEKRHQALARAEFYLSGLSKAADDQLKRPLELVADLLRRRRAESAKT